MTAEPRGHGWYPLAMWAAPKLDLARIAGADVRILPLPGNTGTGQIPASLRLQWVAVGRNVQAAAKGKGKGKDQQSGTMVKKIKHIHVHKFRMLPRPRAKRPVPPPGPPPAALVPQPCKHPVLLLSFGEHQEDLAKAAGCREPIDVRQRLSDQAAPPLRGCTGESGHLMYPAVQKDAFQTILAQASKVIEDERTRPGGAVVGFMCRAGRHRSVLMVVLLEQYLRDNGYPTEKRHLGAYRRKPDLCHCGQGPLLTMCPEVASRAPNAEVARKLYTEHLELRARAHEITGHHLGWLL